MRRVYFVSCPDATISFSRPATPPNSTRASEKKNRNAISRETGGSAGTARSHRCFVARPVSNLPLNLFRKFAEVGRFELDHGPGPRARKPCLLFAGFPGILARLGRPYSHPAEQRGHFLFLLLQTQNRDRLRKVLDGEQASRPSHRSDSHGSEPRVKDVFSMAGRIHPTGVNGLGIRADGNVLRDGAEPRASFGQALLQLRFTGELVFEHVQIDHAQCVLAGGFEERVIPLKFGKALRRALAVQGLEELPLRAVSVQQFRLRTGVRANEKQKKRGQKNFHIAYGGSKKPESSHATSD